MRASSRSRCKRYITLIRRRRRRKSHIDDRDRGRVVLIVGVKLEPNVGKARVGRGSEEILGFVGDKVTVCKENGEGTKLAADGS
jgi:hypothetical protein